MPFISHLGPSNSVFFFFLLTHVWGGRQIRCYEIVVTRGVHGSVQVGFMPNPQPTRFHRVNDWTTRRRPQTTSGRVGLDSGGQRLGRSASYWQSITGFSPDRSWKSTHQTQIWAKITDLSKNRSKNITWSSDLSENLSLSPDLSENRSTSTKSSPDRSSKSPH